MQHRSRRLLLLGLLAVLSAAPFAAWAQPRVLTPGKIKITELDPTEDLNGKLISPPLEQNQGMIQILIEPELARHVKLEDIPRWFRESRMTIEQITFDRNQINVRRDGDIMFRFTYPFLTGVDDVTRRVQIRQDATNGIFRNYFQSHRFYRQRVTRLSLGVAEEPVLEKEAKGRIVLNGPDLQDIDVEAVNTSGVTLKFDRTDFELPSGQYTLNVIRAGYDRFRQRIDVQTDQTLEINVALKRSAGAAIVSGPASQPVQAVSRFRDEALNRLKATRTITARRPAVTGAFHPDGSYLAVAHADNSVYLWDLAKGQPINILPGHTSEILSIAFYPEQDLLFTVSETAVISFNLKTGKALYTIGQRELQRNGIRGAVLIPDGNLIAALGKDNSLRVYSVAQRKEMALLEDAGAANALVWVPEWKAYAALGTEGTVKVRQGVQVAARNLTADGSLARAFVNSTKSFFVAGSEDAVFIRNTVSIFSIAGQGNTPILSVKASAPVAYYENGILVAADNNSRQLSLFDANSGNAIYTARNIVVGEKLAALSPDGKMFVTNGQGNELLIHDLSLLQEWQTVLQFSNRFGDIAKAGADLPAMRARLKKKRSLFQNQAAQKKYDDLIAASAREIEGEANAVVTTLKNAQLAYASVLHGLENDLMPQQTIETRAEYEKRTENALMRIAGAREIYEAAEASALTTSDQVLLKSLVFELTNESAGIPLKTGTAGADGRTPVAFGPLQSFITIPAGTPAAAMAALSRPESWSVEQSDVTVSPVVHRLKAQPEGMDAPVYLGGEGFSVAIPNDKLFTNLFTIDLKASGTVNFTLTDKKSVLEATAVKDGVTFTKVLSDKDFIVSFRPGTYELKITSKKNRPIERWTLTVEPGSSQTLTFNQIGATKPSAFVVFQGEQTPYNVSIALPDKKTLLYTIWSASQSLELPKGAYGFSYSKKGFQVNGRSAVTLAPGMREDMPVTFVRLAEGQTAEVKAPVAQAQPKNQPEARQPEAQPETQPEIRPRKKGGVMKWLLLAAAAGGAGYYLTQGDSGPSTLPVPPGRPN